MYGINGVKNVSFQDDVSQSFMLVVIDSDHYNGYYHIHMPDGFEQVVSFVDINDEFFNVDNFILGDSTDLEFVSYNNPKAFDIIDKVYKEKGGDGQIIFQWYINGNDVLGSDFQLNLNKISYQYEKSSQKIVTEIKKRESQNKIFAREDTSVDLARDKNLDGNEISPVETQDILFKELRRPESNFYPTDVIKQHNVILAQQGYLQTMKLSGERNIGNNNNIGSGFFSYFGGKNYVRYLGDQISTNTDIDDLSITMSNIEMLGRQEGDSRYHTMTLVALIKDNNGKPVNIIPLKTGEKYMQDGVTFSRIHIISEKYTNYNLRDNNTSFPLSLKAGQSLEISFYMDYEGYFEYDKKAYYEWVILSTKMSIEITANFSKPLKSIKAITLKNALDQVCKNYSDGKISVESNILGQGGAFEHTGISSGIMMRNIPDAYMVSNKFSTSLKSLFYDGAAPLLALGFDILKDKFIVEDVDYFFKDIQVYDLSGKGFDEYNYELKNSLADAFNNLYFGCKKYSTNKKSDLKNYNTFIEASTPIKSAKTKFDKKTNLIIDEFKIQEIINDSSTKTSESDDDIVLIDMIKVSEYTDQAVILNCVHIRVNEHLELRSSKTPFDQISVSQGDIISINSGLNNGYWEVLAKTSVTLKLKSTKKNINIQEGTVHTPISYDLKNIIKNRSDEGFIEKKGILNSETTSNLRHNPKFQMARWFGYFGSGLDRKKDIEQISVNKYKNNGSVELQVDSLEIPNELQGLTRLQDNEDLKRLRTHKQPYFTNREIEITIPFVSFEEFFQLYKNWRFGINGDRLKNRGYITVDTPEGKLNIYPFGRMALEHDKKFNELTIRGKVKKNKNM
ncbi:hypothetical protein GNY06_05100 [Elizabethkingia argentiflava]|uniref:Uncharacterized protein n=1 Tax=Elizabethkingia argenteiflava TaxID=2681556 RepID=A0A845PT16_9FLAO|nr:hypothetical protein [Elizabethkingia argenteiflava]NAW50785.1 hypothetical protein [Elizabethkingia argenteiflava]